jgi:hypothetical protein
MLYQLSYTRLSYTRESCPSSLLPRTEPSWWG